MKTIMAILLLLFLAIPLRAEVWVVLSKPSLEVIGTFTLEKGGALNIDIDTRDLCIKTFEITEPVPADLVKVITTKAGQVVMEGKSVAVVSVSISKKEIKAGFTAQKYKYDLQKRKFELKQMEVIPK